MKGLSVHIVLLITAMLVHGFAPSLLTYSVRPIIPIATGHQINIIESANYLYYFEFDYV
jgi:hypothetical protein